MKKYIEAFEQGSGEDLDFIKQEITIEESKDKTLSKNKIKSKEKSGKTYKYRIHTCFHEENQPCTVEDI